MTDKVTKNNRDWKMTDELLTEYWGPAKGALENDGQILSRTSEAGRFLR